MTEREAKSLAVPMRFLVTLKEALAKNKAGDSSQGAQELLSESIDKQARQHQALDPRKPACSRQNLCFYSI